jgi:mono/diheme cytochrome c family protein
MKWKAPSLLIASLVMAALFTDCQDNPYKQGKILYENFCSNCHMDDGSGLEGNIPPLAKADWLKENQDQLACLIRYGVENEMIVNGVTYNNPMAGIPALSAFEITNVINYINHAWGNNYGLAKYEEVNNALENCQ